MPCSNFVLIILHALFSVFLYSAWWQATKCTQDVACQVKFICQPTSIQYCIYYPVWFYSNDIVHTTCSPAMVFCVCCHKMIVGILLQWRNIHISQCPVWFSAANFSIVVAKLSWNTVEYYFYMFTHSYRFLLLLPTSFHLGSWVSTTWLLTPSLSVQVSLTSMLHAQPAWNYVWTIKYKPLNMNH